MFNNMWDVKEPKHYSKRVGREVPGVVAVLCVVNTGPMLIAVTTITKIVILYKYVEIIIIIIIRKRDLKKETEGVITAAQDQALRSNAIKAKVEKQNLFPLCRMCGEKDESMGHLVGECSKLAQAEYKHRHDNVPRMIHWNIAHS